MWFFLIMALEFQQTSLVSEIINLTSNGLWMNFLLDMNLHCQRRSIMLKNRELLDDVIWEPRFFFQQTFRFLERNGTMRKNSFGKELIIFNLHDLNVMFYVNWWAWVFFFSTENPLSPFFETLDSCRTWMLETCCNEHAKIILRKRMTTNLYVESPITRCWCLLMFHVFETKSHFLTLSLNFYLHLVIAHPSYCNHFDTYRT